MDVVGKSRDQAKYSGGIQNLKMIWKVRSPTLIIDSMYDLTHSRRDTGSALYGWLLENEGFNEIDGK